MYNLTDLLDAIKLSDIDKVDSIINLCNYNINYNHCDSLGMTPLHYACMYDYNYDIVCRLLSLTEQNNVICNRNIKDIYNRTPLMVAYINGATEISEIMCGDMHVDINCQDIEKNTPLHLVCMKKYKNINMINILLEHYDTPYKMSKLSTLKKNINGDTPLMLTLEYADTSIWRIFFNKMNINLGSNIEYISNIFDKQFFKKLIKYNNIRFVNFLYDTIGDQKMSYLLNIQDDHHMKPLHYILDQPELTNDDKILYHKFISLGSIINDTIMIDKKEQLGKKNLITKIKNKIKKQKNIIMAEEWEKKISTY